MSILAVHAAIRALVPAGVTHHEGQAPTTAVAPWIVTGFNAPDPTTSEAAQGIAKTGTLTVTITTEAEDATNYWIEQVDDAFVGAVVALTGWQVGALTPGTRSGPYPAGLTSTDTNLRYQVARLGFRFTYSRNI